MRLIIKLIITAISILTINSGCATTMKKAADCMADTQKCWTDYNEKP